MLKTAPYIVAGFTATAALAGSLLLAAQDRDLFEPQHAMVLVDQAGSALGLTAEPRSVPAVERRTPPRRLAHVPSAARERR